MASGSYPIQTFQATLMALSGVAQSSSLTVTVALTQGWELQIGFQFSHVGSISADPVLFVYRSLDGGVNFDSNAWQTFSLPRVGGSSSGSRTTSITLPTGQYVLQLQNSGPNSAVFAVLTQLVIGTVYNA